MTVGLKLAPTIYEIGTGSFFNAFFSTVSHRLEPKGWGTVYPILMNKLYYGELSPQDADAALRELLDVREKLKRFKPEDVIWDIENLEAKPPWGDNISKHISDLSNYFVTSTGKDLIELLTRVVGYLKQEGGKIEIVQYQGYPSGNAVRWEHVSK